MSAVRPAAVAGMFYPEAARALSAQVHAYLEHAAPAAGPARPKALIVPHAGYVYSGPIAATAYARLSGSFNAIRRAVLLGPAHRVPLRGLPLAAIWLTMAAVSLTFTEMSERCHRPMLSRHRSERFRSIVQRLPVRSSLRK